MRSGAENAGQRGDRKRWVSGYLVRGEGKIVNSAPHIVGIGLAITPQYNRGVMQREQGVNGYGEMWLYRLERPFVKIAWNTCYDSGDPEDCIGVHQLLDVAAIIILDTHIIDDPEVSF